MRPTGGHGIPDRPQMHFLETVLTVRMTPDRGEMPDRGDLSRGLLCETGAVQ